MHPKTASTDNIHILYDDDLYGKVDSQWFDVGYWEKKGRVVKASQGRGETRFVQAGQDDLVLRHYQRGGWVASLLADRYFFTGLARTRAWQEWYLLEKMMQLGLPVPQPVAARVVRIGGFYRQDIIIKRLVDTAALSKLLLDGNVPSDVWVSVGQCIRRFHQAGVDHADLNAHNILLDKDGKVYLIDFDKGGFRSKGKWQAANIARLKRSLHKLKQQPGFSFAEEDWDACMQGYS